MSNCILFFVYFYSDIVKKEKKFMLFHYTADIA